MLVLLWFHRPTTCDLMPGGHEDYLLGMASIQSVNLRRGVKLLVGCYSTVLTIVCIHCGLWATNQEKLCITDFLLRILLIGHKMMGLLLRRLFCPCRRSPCPLPRLLRGAWSTRYFILVDLLLQIKLRKTLPHSNRLVLHRNLRLS